MKTTRKDINLVEGWVKVEAATSKMQQRWVVYPRPEALAALRVALALGELPLHPAKRRKIIQGYWTRWKTAAGEVQRLHHGGLRGALGLKTWPKDITRHSAASYWLALEPDCAALAEQLGNSPEVLRRHYRAVVTRAEAEKFWAVLGALAKQPNRRHQW